MLLVDHSFADVFDYLSCTFSRWHGKCWMEIELIWNSVLLIKHLLNWCRSWIELLKLLLIHVVIRILLQDQAFTDIVLWLECFFRINTPITYKFRSWIEVNQALFVDLAGWGCFTICLQDLLLLLSVFSSSFLFLQYCFWRNEACCSEEQINQVFWILYSIV